MMFEFAEDNGLLNTDRLADIKVVGVGGAGGNAVGRMIEAGLVGVEFFAVNTDLQALHDSPAHRTLQIGAQRTKGLGSGGNPSVGRAAAEEDLEQLRDALSGADMVFVTAGMGGGTGTGAAPVIARVARELGALTVAIVTKPFRFEASVRMQQALAGIEELRQSVDTLIIIPNQRLLEVVPAGTSMREAFRIADNVLYEATRGIYEIISRHDHVNLDFADVRTVMKDMGQAMMGTGRAEGPNRAVEAARQAISSPLLENVNIHGSRAVLVNVLGREVGLQDTAEAMEFIQDAAGPQAHVIFGYGNDESMGDMLQLTVIATGFDAASTSEEVAAAQARLAATLAAPVAGSVAEEAGEDAVEDELTETVVTWVDDEGIEDGIEEGLAEDVLEDEFDEAAAAEAAEAAAQAAAEEEARRREEQELLELEAQLRAIEEEEARAAEEAARLAAEAEEARLRAEEEARVAAEAEAARLRAEEEARLAAEAEEARRLAHEQALREAQEARERAEHEARVAAEAAALAEARRVAAEEEIRQRAEQDALDRAAYEVQLREEMEARVREELEARLREEYEARVREEQRQRDMEEQEARELAAQEAQLEQARAAAAAWAEVPVDEPGAGAGDELVDDASSDGLPADGLPTDDLPEPAPRAHESIIAGDDEPAAPAAPAKAGWSLFQAMKRVQNRVPQDVEGFLARDSVAGGEPRTPAHVDAPVTPERPAKPTSSGPGLFLTRVGTRGIGEVEVPDGQTVQAVTRSAAAGLGPDHPNADLSQPAYTRKYMD